MRDVSHIILILAGAATAAITALAAKLLMPLLQHYALARPNARSSHSIPTPQGGGIAILIAMMVAGGLLVATGFLPLSHSVMSLLVAALALGLLGGWDDIQPLPATLRLLVQAGAVAAVILALPPLQILPPQALPPPAWLSGLNLAGLKLAILILAGVWFVNLTNFMDGLDWLTVAGFVPLTAFMALLGAWGIIAPTPAIIAALLCGALAGFAPFNKPVARLFLGDIGSLSIGLIVAWLLYNLAMPDPAHGMGGSLTAAVLLPLYHLTDATLTLLQRLKRRERVWQAHRAHAYQRATDHGFSAMAVAGHVFGLNLVLCILAAACLVLHSSLVNLASLGLGLGLTLLLVRRFTAPAKSVVRLP